MKSMRLLFSFIAFLFCSFAVNAALSSQIFSSDKDSYITPSFSNADYGGASNFNVGTRKVTKFSYTYDRGYVYFDFGSILPNAIIYSADLRLTVSGTNGNDPSWDVVRVMSNWVETGTGHISANNQPGLSTFSNDLVSSNSQSGATRSFDVTDMVQRMVYQQITNHGWSIRTQTETASQIEHVEFYSREHSVSTQRPTLTIQYYYPPTLSNVLVTHESQSNADDGSIGFDINNLPSTSFQYSWTNGINGSGVSSVPDLTGLSYGWYGLNVTGEQYGEEYYIGFIVGTECEEVSIEFSPDENFMDNAQNTSLNSGINNFSNTNEGNTVNFQTSREALGRTLYNRNSYIRFRLWMPEDVKVNQADFTLQGKSHSGSNIARLDKVATYWDEMLITWSAQPTINTSVSLTVPANSGSNDATLNLVPFWEDWQVDNSTNHGLRFGLQTYATEGTRQNYHSPTALNSSDKPKIDFKIDLRKEATPFYCNPMYASLERKLTGVLYKTQLNKLYFYFDNEYASASNNLNYTVYAHDDMLSSITAGNMSNLPVGFGRNQYILETDNLTPGEVYVIVVTNDKDEKRYLRFEQE